MSSVPLRAWAVERDCLKSYLRQVGSPEAAAALNWKAAGMVGPPVFESELARLMEAPTPRRAIEVGAASAPICGNCIQVDRYRSIRDASFQLFRAKHGRDPSPRELAQELANDVPSQIDLPFAAARRGGVVADASQLPFRDASVSKLISKNFPWLQQDPETRLLIQQVLTEYKRVLSEGGYAVLVTNNTLNEATSLFKTHIEIARSLGFRIRMVETRTMNGILLYR